MQRPRSKACPFFNHGCGPRRKCFLDWLKTYPLQIYIRWACTRLLAKEGLLGSQRHLAQQKVFSFCPCFFLSTNRLALDGMLADRCLQGIRPTCHFIMFFKQGSGQHAPANHHLRSPLTFTTLQRSLGTFTSSLQLSLLQGPGVEFMVPHVPLSQCRPFKQGPGQQDL